MYDVNELPTVDLRAHDATQRMVAGLRSHGVALFRGGRDRRHLIRIAHSLVAVRNHRDSDSDGVTTIVSRPAAAARTSYAGFTDRELWPHTDGTALATPARTLILACVQPARSGGHARLVDGRDVHAEIARTDRAMLEALSAPRAAHFGGASGHRGPIFQQTTGGRVTIRLRFDQPDGFSPALAGYVDRLRMLVRSQALDLDLQAGQGYILLNDRWLHGRSSFVEDREMLRVLGDPLACHRLPRGFEPAAEASPTSRRRLRGATRRPRPGVGPVSAARPGGGRPGGRPW